MITERINKAARVKLKRELDKAANLDSGLKILLDKFGYPPSHSRPPGFATLLQTIVSQQLSTRAAATIWQRLEKLCNRKVTYRKILNRDATQLKSCGLSRQKIDYCYALAKMVANKTIDLQPAIKPHQDTEPLINELCKVRGIGRWSAEIYAMFALGCDDIFPSGDLALQVAVGRYKSLPNRPDEKTTAALAEKWSPHRSSVALLMWRYYGATTLD